MEIEKNQAAELDKPVFFGSLEILTMTRPAQSQNGLKHGDYLRYRRYCAKKVKRMRKLLKYSFGRHKYQKKNILVDMHDEPKILHILLFEIECDWSYGMDLQTNLINIKDEQEKRKKFHMRKKFKQAYKGSQNLVNFAQGRVDAKSQSEIEAYSKYLGGIYHQSMNQWDQALGLLVSSRIIYEHLSKISDPLQGVLYKEKLEQLDQGIRFCYQKQGGSIFDSLEKILQLQQQKTNQSQEKYAAQQLQQNLQGPEKMVQMQGFMEVEFFGQKYPIKTQKVIEMSEMFKQKALNLSSFKSKESSYKLLDKKLIQKSDLSSQKLSLQAYFEDLFQMYIDLFNVCDDIIRLLQKEKDTQANTDGEKTIYQNIINHFLLQKLDYLLDRNTIYVMQAIQKFDEEDGLNNLQLLATKKAFKLKLTRPSEIVKLCDNLIQAVKQIMDIERLNPNLEKFRKMDILEMLYKGVRCFFVSCVYVSNDKYKEGISLIAQSENIFKLCTRKFEEIKLPADLKLHAECMQNIIQKMQVLTVRIKILTNYDQILGEQQVSEKVANLNLSGQNNLSLGSIDSLIEQSLQSSQPKHVSLEQISGLPIINMPGQIQTVPSQPIFLELVQQQVKYPTITKQQGQEKTSFWSKFNIFKRN